MPKKKLKQTPIQTRIRVPGNFYRQPIISRIISRYEVTVNIKAAYLQFGNENEGWFDIDLFGQADKLTNTLSYLQKLGVDLLQVEIAKNVKASLHQLPTNNHQILSNANLKQDFHPLIITSSHLPNVYQTTHSQLKAEIINSQLTRIPARICISRKYHQKPIISTLVSRYKIMVNISSAILQSDTKDDGWFDLEFWGKVPEIHDSLTYLEQLGIPIFIGSYAFQNNNVRTAY